MRRGFKSRHSPQENVLVGPTIEDDTRNTFAHRVPRRRNLSGMGSITTRRTKPDAPHYVYRFWDAKGRALYIGMTASPSGRIATHAGGLWWHLVDKFDAEVHPSRESARVAEAHQIEQHQPRFNFYHSDAAIGSRSRRGAGGVAFSKTDVIV